MRGADVDAITLPGAQAEHFRGLVTGGPEPVRQPGVELGDLTRRQGGAVLGRDEADPAGEHGQPGELSMAPS